MSSTDVREDDPGPAEAGIDPTQIVCIQPRDPLVLRDARPFSNDPGAHAFALPFPLPRTVAGAIRTAYGDDQGVDWGRHADVTRVHGMQVHGPILTAQGEAGGAWEPYFPAPRDVVFHPDKNNPTAIGTMLLRPVERPAGGIDGPRPPERTAESLAKVMGNVDLKPLSVPDDVKPAKELPTWWSLGATVRWLNAVHPEPTVVNTGNGQTVAGLGALKVDTRVHVRIDRDTGTHVEGALFTTESRALPQLPGFGSPALALLARVALDSGWNEPERVVAFGGERRVASLSVNPSGQSWPEVRYPTGDELAKATGIRLQLVTPGLFRHGWLPGWLESGVIPGTKGMKAQVVLKGAAIDRRIPVSGWRLAGQGGGDGTFRHPGPRATRYAVPAGGVYFFAFHDAERERDEAWWHELWSRLWLRPISDFAIDNASGFGLVLPGLW